MTTPFWPIPAGYELYALFGTSFLAATLLPLGSEWLLALLIARGFSSPLTVTVAVIGNTLGSFTTYAIGYWGRTFLWQRLLRIDQAELDRAQRFYQRFGRYSLLGAWLPIVGDPLCLFAGSFRLNFLSFAVLVGTGKLGRYAAVAYMAGLVNSSV